MRRGSTEPRIWTPPLRELTPETSLGYLFADFCDKVAETPLLPWQRWLGIHALEIIGDLDGEWSFRFRFVIVLVARQNGKSKFLALLNLFFLYVLGTPLTVGTAQNLDIAEEVWEDAIDIAESVDELCDQIKTVARRNGNKALRLDTGERYKIVAATRKGGRGLSADLVSMDELREQVNWEAWGAVTKTTMARPRAQVWGISNAGDESSVVLRHLRMMCHEDLGDPDGIAGRGIEATEDPDAEDVGEVPGLFEWSSTPGCDVADRDEWALANPSLGYGFLTERALVSAMRTDPEPIFRTECLCQWVTALVVEPFKVGGWAAGVDESSEIPMTEDVFFGLDMSADRSKVAICACGRRADGDYHGELVAYRVGFDWAVEWLRKISYRKRVKVAVQGRGAPISAYIDDLSGIKGVDLRLCEGKDVGAWTGRIYDAVAACLPDEGGTPIRHRTQPALDLAAKIGKKKKVGDGAWCWDRVSSQEDISPIVALTMAYGLATGGGTGGRSHRSAYAGERGLLVV